MNSSENNSNSLTNDLTDIYNMIFTKTTVVLLIWFLALHFVCYWLLKYFFSEDIENLDYQSKLSRFLDIAVLIFISLFLTASYYSMPQNDKEIILENIASKTKEYIKDKDSVYKTVVFILFFYCIIYLFRIPMNYQTKPYFISGIEYTSWSILVVIIFTKFFEDVFSFSMLDTIYDFLNWSNMDTSYNESSKQSKVVQSNTDQAKNTISTNKTNNLFTFTSIFSTTKPPVTSSKVPVTTAKKNATTTTAPSATTTTAPSATTTTAPSATTKPPTESSDSKKKVTPTIESFDTNIIETTPTPSIKIPEVFNVLGGYTYDQAQYICKAYDAELANYDQIENTYNTGGEWCNYGWSDGQHALFPTQKTTWEKLQKSADPNKRISCGRPGVNGGYITNSNTKLGVNCYGIKPELLAKDTNVKEQEQGKVFAKSKEDEEIEKKVEFWKEQIKYGNVNINHHNYQVWSKNDVGPNSENVVTPTVYNKEKNGDEISSVNPTKNMKNISNAKESRNNESEKIPSTTMIPNNVSLDLTPAKVPSTIAPANVESTNNNIVKRKQK